MQSVSYVNREVTDAAQFQSKFQRKEIRLNNTWHDYAFQNIKCFNQTKLCILFTTLSRVGLASRLPEFNQWYSAGSIDLYTGEQLLFQLALSTKWHLISTSAHRLFHQEKISAWPDFFIMSFLLWLFESQQ